jgi:hypothetical protein
MGLKELMNVNITGVSLPLHLKKARLLIKEAIGDYQSRT